MKFKIKTKTYPSNVPGAPLSFAVRELILPEYLLLTPFCFCMLL